jgi:pantoate--beta-alanine ligase
MTTVVNTRAELAAARRQLDGRVAVVMTMGALHDGHVELMRAARQAADHVVVTVFVNPLQFGVNEDFDRYPRTLDDDVRVCIREGVDLVFAPDVAEMYPNGQPEVHVSAGSLGDRLEGQHRPGHFDGVLTVVAKLLHLIRPDVAVFGAKDAQQLALIRRMVADLDLGVELLGVETVREPDGLARSSRNRYLDETDRAAALAIPKALQAAVDAAAEGPAAARVAAEQVLADEPALAVDYVALVDDASWLDADEQTRAARLLVAARVGTTRLIDNVVLHLGTRAG